MTPQEVITLVNRYIGVTSDGYLTGYSYRTHAEFYPLFCQLDYDPSKLTGSTRSKFVEILNDAPPLDQAKIIRGALLKTPPDDCRLATRTQALHDQLMGVARRLETGAPVPSPDPKITSEVVRRAIADAESLLKDQGATSGVDRLHTALQGYLRAVCDDAGLDYSEGTTINGLFILVRNQHPRFTNTGPRAQDITTVMRAMGSIMDAMNPVRNSASMAHPNKELLDAPEAMLVINAARTILHYLDAKLG